MALPLHLQGQEFGDLRSGYGRVVVKRKLDAGLGLKVLSRAVVRGRIGGAVFAFQSSWGPSRWPAGWEKSGGL